MNQDQKPITRFPLGSVVATPGVLANLELPEMFQFLARHVSGDWGEVDPEDVQENELSLAHGFRLLSAYTSSKGAKFWIITEADRSVTTFLLPQEY